MPERPQDARDPAEMLAGAPGRQHHVDGPDPGVLQLRGDITGMVDDQVGAHRHAPFPGFAAGRRRNDLGAGARFQELDRHRADGASAADDQDALHRLRKQILLAEHRFPRGQAADGQGRRVREGEVVRDAGDEAVVDSDQLGPGAVAQHVARAVDPVADIEAGGRRSQRFDDAGKFQAEQHAPAGLGALRCAEHRLAGIDADGFDLDEDIGGPQFGIGKLGDRHRELFDGMGVLVDESFHGKPTVEPEARAVLPRRGRRCCGNRRRCPADVAARPVTCTNRPGRPWP